MSRYYKVLGALALSTVLVSCSESTSVGVQGELSQESTLIPFSGKMSVGDADKTRIAITTGDDMGTRWSLKEEFNGVDYRGDVVEITDFTGDRNDTPDMDGIDIEVHGEVWATANRVNFYNVYPKLETPQDDIFSFYALKDYSHLGNVAAYIQKAGIKTSKTHQGNLLKVNYKQFNEFTINVPGIDSEDPGFNELLVASREDVYESYGENQPFVSVGLNQDVPNDGLKGNLFFAPAHTLTVVRVRLDQDAMATYGDEEITKLEVRMSAVDQAKKPFMTSVMYNMHQVRTEYLSFVPGQAMTLARVSEEGGVNKIGTTINYVSQGKPAIIRNRFLKPTATKSEDSYGYLKVPIFSSATDDLNKLDVSVTFFNGNKKVLTLKEQVQCSGHNKSWTLGDRLTIDLEPKDIVK